MENPEALGFHQETTKESRQRTETTENLTEIPGLLLYQTLHYFFFWYQNLHHFLSMPFLET